MHPSIFSNDQWQVIMFWYAVLSSIGGGFLLLTVVSSGYKYMGSALNPGIRVSFMEDIQRAVLAMLLVVMAPFFVTLLSAINDGFVWLFAELLNHFADNPQMKETVMDQAEGLFESIIAAPFKTLIKIFNTLLGLKDLDELIFNKHTEIFGSSLFKTAKTGNVFADILLDGSLSAFSIYFNAIYTIRMWVITATLVSTPIIVWVWAITAERHILEVWIAEIIQTIFTQAAHALSLGIFTSIAAYKGSTTGNINTTWLSNDLVQIGVFIAGFGGSICVTVVIFTGMKMILAKDEKERSSAKEGLIKAFIALLILGLCFLIASFLAALLSGNWGVS